MSAKVAVHISTSETSKTYVFTNEDHTLGNALRHVLLRKPSVSFAGYTCPHPSEPKMHLRLQTTGVPANQVLREALEELKEISLHVKNTIADAVEQSSVPAP